MPTNLKITQLDADAAPTRDDLLVSVNDPAGSPANRKVTIETVLTLAKDTDPTFTDVTTNNASTTKHGYLKKLSGTATEFMNGAGNWATPSGSGTVVQVVNTQTGAVATGTTTIPMDDTIPQNTEGTEFMTLAITPTSSTNKLKIEVQFFFAETAACWTIAALFQDSTADALAAGWTFENYVNSGGGISFTHYMTAGTTSATTFKVRAGPHSASTLTFNGAGSARFLGGVVASSITISEIVP